MKILFVISLLAIAASSVLAFMARTTLKEARADKDTTNKSILDIHNAVEKMNGETRSIWADWTNSQLAAKDEDKSRKDLERETTDEENKIKELLTQIGRIEMERVAMQQKIDEAVKGAGTPEEVVAKVSDLKGVTDALAKELGALKGDLEVHTKAAGASDAESSRRKAIQNFREKTINLAGRAATILEVNPEFSFVLMNIGRNDGLTTDSKLMVMRGGVHIANLKIVAIESNRTVADIELKTLRAGLQVVPGDNVVIETSVK